MSPGFQIRHRALETRVSFPGPWVELYRRPTEMADESSNRPKPGQTSGESSGHRRLPRISLRCTGRRAFSSAASDRPGRGVAAASSGTAAGENIVYTLNDLTIAVPATIENLRVVELRPDSTA
jgi:hypothetical protein